MVTAGSSIGAAIARLLAPAAPRYSVVDLDRAKAEAVVADIGQAAAALLPIV